MPDPTLTMAALAALLDTAHTGLAEEWVAGVHLELDQNNLRDLRDLARALTKMLEVTRTVSDMCSDLSLVLADASQEDSDELPMNVIGYQLSVVRNEDFAAVRGALQTVIEGLYAHIFDLEAEQNEQDG
jgi:hypothetical protein